ncbi:hypothetical protein JL09_g6642, partial [Pichia kudriavzevii]
LDEVILE